MRGLQIPPAKHTSHAQGENKVRVSWAVLVGANFRQHRDFSLSHGSEDGRRLMTGAEGSTIRGWRRTEVQRRRIEFISATE
jgi:hypothetical protein